MAGHMWPVVTIGLINPGRGERMGRFAGQASQTGLGCRGFADGN